MKGISSAALEGISGAGALADVLLKVGKLTPNSFFLGLLVASSRSVFFSSLAARHCARKS